jgi:hypothetical protein
MVYGVPFSCTGLVDKSLGYLLFTSRSLVQGEILTADLKGPHNINRQSYERTKAVLPFFDRMDCYKEFIFQWINTTKNTFWRNTLQAKATDSVESHTCLRQTSNKFSMYLTSIVETNGGSLRQAADAVSQHKSIEELIICDDVEAFLVSAGISYEHQRTGHWSVILDYSWTTLCHDCTGNYRHDYLPAWWQKVYL